MKISIYMLAISLLLLSCKDNSNPIKTDPPNQYAQKEIEWPSLQKAPWPMYRHDPQLTGRTKHTGPSLVKIADSINVGYDVANIIIDIDSQYMVSSSKGLIQRNISKWKYTSKLLWGKDFGISMDTYNSPILISTGYYYVSPNRIFFIKNDTTIFWTYDPPAPIFSVGSTTDKNGNLYLKNGSPGGLTVLSPSGDLMWSMTIPSSGIHAVSFSPDGNTTYVTSSTLVAIDITSHSIKWSKDSIGIATSPVVDNEGNIYFFSKNASTNHETFRSVTPDGSVRWSYSDLSSVKPSSEHGIEPVIDWDGNVYCATDTVYSFTNDGNLRWKVGLEKGERNYTSLTCDGSNTVYVLTTKNNVYAITNSGLIKWKLNIPNAWFGMAPSVADGKLFVPTYGPKVYIIE